MPEHGGGELHKAKPPRSRCIFPSYHHSRTSSIVGGTNLHLGVFPKVDHEVLMVLDT